MKLFKIEENDANQRLDKFLRKLMPNATRSLVFKFNRKWKIKINWKKKDNEYKLEIWDEVKIFLRDEEFKELTEVKKEETKVENKLDKKNIVYEDKWVLVVNKEAWINVHPWDHKTKEVSLIEQVHDYFWNSLNSFTFKPSLAHRLDRDTSWAIVIWKQKHVLEWLVSDFKNHKITKIYHTLVIWKMSSKEGTIKKKLLRIENAKNENKIQVSEKGQNAVTHYKVLNEYEIKTENWPQIISELEVKLETGRMHQIRVHLSHLNHPIVWDDKYWDKKFNYYIAKHFWLKRQALHSWKLEFFHKWRDKKIWLTARLKKDTEDFINKIKKS